MIRAEMQSQVATRILRDLDKDVRKAIAQDSKGIGDDLVAKIRADNGVAPYGRVYAKLARTAKVRTRAGRPPEVVVGGAGRFSGGATVTQVVRGYEYGSLTGDLRLDRAGRRLSAQDRAGRGRRHRRARPLPQFPPKSNEGMWVNKVCEAYEKGPLLEAWLDIINTALDDTAGGS
jgi:hypothetical protein